MVTQPVLHPAVLGLEVELLEQPQTNERLLLVFADRCDAFEGGRHAGEPNPAPGGGESDALAVIELLEPCFDIAERVVQR